MILLSLTLAYHLEARVWVWCTINDSSSHCKWFNIHDCYSGWFMDRQQHNDSYPSASRLVIFCQLKMVSEPSMHVSGIVSIIVIW